jgi:hypothetical protein
MTDFQATTKHHVLMNTLGEMRNISAAEFEYGGLIDEELMQIDDKRFSFDDEEADDETAEAHERESEKQDLTEQTVIMMLATAPVMAKHLIKAWLNTYNKGLLIEGWDDIGDTLIMGLNLAEEIGTYHLDTDEQRTKLADILRTLV